MEAARGDRKRARSPGGDNSEAQTSTEDHNKAMRRRRRRRQRQLLQQHPDDQRIGNTSILHHHGDDAEEYCSSSSSSGGGRGYVLNNNEDEEEERLIFDFPWLKEGPISNADDYKLLLEENAFFGSPSSNDHLLLLHDHDHHREEGELASASFCSSCGNGGGLEQKAADRANMVDLSSLRGAGELEGPDWIWSSVFDQPLPSAAAGLDKYN